MDFKNYYLFFPKIQVLVDDHINLHSFLEFKNRISEY